jgi:hypothetical protein
MFARIAGGRCGWSRASQSSARFRNCTLMAAAPAGSPIPNRPSVRERLRISRRHRPPADFSDRCEKIPVAGFLFLDQAEAINAGAWGTIRDQNGRHYIGHCDCRRVRGTRINDWAKPGGSGRRSLVHHRQRRQSALLVCHLAGLSAADRKRQPRLLRAESLRLGCFGAAGATKPAAAEEVSRSRLDDDFRRRFARHLQAVVHARRDVAIDLRMLALRIGCDHRQPGV